MLDKASQSGAQASSPHYVNTVQLTSGEIALLISAAINSATQTRKNRLDGKRDATRAGEDMHRALADKLFDALPEEAWPFVADIIRPTLKTWRS